MGHVPVAARRPFVAVLVALAALAAGCAPKAGQDQAAKAPLTEHQRDSILATEPIPGAPAVGAALAASAKEAKRAAEMDSTLR
jgi:hypothetical protein